MFVQQKHNSTFRRNLLLNLVSAVLISALVLVLLSQMISRFQAQEMFQRRDLMENEIAYVSNELNVLSSLFMQSKYPDSLQRLSLIQKNLQASDYYALHIAQNYLASLASANGLIADVVLSFANSGILLTSENVYITPEQFSAQYRTIGFDSRLFTESPRTDSVGYDLFPGGAVCPLNKATRRIAFICRIPLGSSTVVYSSCHVYLLISYDALMDAFLTENMRALGSLELLDQNENILCTYSAQDEFSRSGTQVSVANASRTLRANAFLPRHYFTLILHDLHVFVTFGLAIVFLLSIFTAWIAAWRQSLPMRRLISDIAQDGMGLPVQKNEYLWLKDNLHRMNHERIDIAQQLEQHRKLVNANTLERLFTGAPLSPEQRVRAEGCLSGLSRPFLVGLARFHFHSTLTNESAQDARTLVMTQRLGQLLPANSLLYTFDTDTVAMLVPCPDGRSAAVSAISSEISAFEDFIGHQMLLTFSLPLDQPQQISTAFDIVLQTCGADDWPDASGIRCVQEQSQDSDFSFRNIQQLYNLLLSADVEGARKALKAFLFSVDHQCGSMRQRFYTVRALMMLAANAAKLDDEPLQHLHYDASDDGQALLMKFESFLPQFSQQADARRLKERDCRIQSILDYFSAHFSDPEFCPAMAASAFSISEKHLYTLLREHANTTPAALLLDLRLSHAAEYLRSSQEPIQKICEESGFANFNTFYKAFKRAYAVSPSQFRDTGADAPLHR